MLGSEPLSLSLMHGHACCILCGAWLWARSAPLEGGLNAIAEWSLLEQDPPMASGSGHHS